MGKWLDWGLPSGCWFLAWSLPCGFLNPRAYKAQLKVTIPIHFSWPPSLRMSLPLISSILNEICLSYRFVLQENVLVCQPHSEFILFCVLNFCSLSVSFLSFLPSLPFFFSVFLPFSLLLPSNMASGSLCSRGRPWAPGPPATAFQVQVFQARPTLMSGWASFFFLTVNSDTWDAVVLFPVFLGGTAQGCHIPAPEVGRLSPHCPTSLYSFRQPHGICSYIFFLSWIWIWGWSQGLELGWEYTSGIGHLLSSGKPRFHPKHWKKWKDLKFSTKGTSKNKIINYWNNVLRVESLLTLTR